MSSNEYFSGQGHLSIGAFNANIDDVGYRGIGNCPSVNFAVEFDKLEHFESTTGDRGQDLSLTRNLVGRVNLLLEDINLANLQLVMQASLNAIALDSAKSTVREVRLGRKSYLGTLNTTITSLTDTATGLITYEEDKNYVVSKANGAVYWMTDAEQTAAGAVVNLVESELVTILYGHLAMSNLEGLTATEQVFTFRIDAMNTADRDQATHIHFFKVVVDPVAVLDLINQELQQMSLSFDVLYFAETPDGSSNYFQVTKTDSYFIFVPPPPPPPPQGWAIQAAVYNGTFFRLPTAIPAEAGSNRVQHVFFNPDETKAYIARRIEGEDIVEQYSLDVTGNINSLVNDNVSIGLGFTSNENLVAAQWSGTGNKLFMLSTQNDRVRQYSAPTPYDLTGMTRDVGVEFDLESDGGMFVSPDGTKLYNSDVTNGNIIEYTFGDVDDISTLVLTFELPRSPASKINGIFIRKNGKEIFTSHFQSDLSSRMVMRTVMATAWDLSTATESSEIFSLREQCHEPAGLWFDQNGVRMYVADRITNTIKQFDIPFFTDVVYPPSGWDVGRRPDSFVTLTDDELVGVGKSGTTVSMHVDQSLFYAFNSTDNVLLTYTLSDPENMRSGTLTHTSTPITGFVDQVWVSPNGLKLYARLGSSGQPLQQYSLSPAFDIESRVLDAGATFNTGYNSTTNFTAYSGDGLKMYHKRANNSFREYDLLNPFDHEGLVEVSTESITGDTVSIRPDGTHFYTTDNADLRIYRLTTPYMLSSRVLVASSEAFFSAETIQFSLDGRKMFVHDTSSTLYQHEVPAFLTPGGDIANGVYSNASLDTTPMLTTTKGFTISSQGNRGWLTGFLTAQDVLAQIAMPDPANIATWYFDRGLVEDTDGSVNAVTSMGLSNGASEFFVHNKTTNLVEERTTGTTRDFYNTSFALAATTPILSTIDTISTHNGQMYPDNFMHTVVYGVSQSAGIIYEYQVPTSSDISTMSATPDQSFSVAATSGDPFAAHFTPDGFEFFVLDVVDLRVYRFVMSTVRDITTASYSGDSIDISNESSDPRGLVFNAAGTRMFITDTTAHRIFQYNIPGF